MKRLVCLFIFLSCITRLAASTEIEFTGELKSVQKESDRVGILTLALTSNFDILVQVTSTTEIRDQGTPISFGDLKVGSTLKVEGVLTPKWVVAREIEVTGEENEFEIRGRLENIDTANREIKILGFVIHVPLGAQIRDNEGRPFAFSELKLGQLVEVEGNISGTALAASEIEVKVVTKKSSHISFEGIVKTINGSEILVEIEGVGPALVILTSDTKIEGTLAVGVGVRISGKLNDDLSVKAQKISVKRLLEAVPRELELGFSKKRTIQLLLSKIFDQDVQVELISLNPSLAQPSVPNLTIAAGKVSGSFDVTSASVEGETFIEARLPAALGGEAARIKVEVEGEDEQKKEVEIKWVPDEVRAGPNEAKLVKLVLNVPAPADLKVQLSLRRGRSGLVEFPLEVDFPKDARVAEITLKAGSDAGEVEIRAKLPAAVGGDHDDLEVEVAGGEQHQKLEVEWVPDELKMRPNQTAIIKLRLDRPALSELTAVVTLKEGLGTLLDFPAQVQFAKGSSEAAVFLRANSSIGKVKIRAALPFSVGGDTADLEINIKADEPQEHPETLHISWIPDEINVKPKETRTVKLRLDRPAPLQLSVILTLKAGSSNLVEFPTHVQFGKSTPEVNVEIKVKDSTGNAEIQAKLPDSVGGKSATLEIEVE